MRLAPRHAQGEALWNISRHPMILILAQAYPPVSGGIQTLMEGLADALARREPTIVLADGGAAARDYDKTRDAPANLSVERFGGPRPLRRWFKRRRVAALAQQSRAVFADSWKSLEALPPLPASIPVVAFGHGNEYPEDGRKVARIRKALAPASALALVSRDTYQRARPFFEGVTQAHLIHPPIHELPPATPEDCAWAAAQWRGEGPRLLSLSRLIGFKGVDTTLRVFARLRRDFPDLELVVAGSGPLETPLKALAGELGVGGLVNFAGRVEGGRKTALMHSAHLYMQPGRVADGEREGFGLTYLEAGLAGLPSISGEAGGAPDAVDHGKTGLVVDGADLDAAIGATRALLADADMRGRLAEGARRKSAMGVWDVKIADYLALIEAR